MSARSMAATAAAVGALVGGAVLTATPSFGDNQSVTVKDVTAQVSRTGGITVGGTMNCSAAVQEAGGVPADTNVMVSVRWTAWQSTGRKSMVTASWPGGGYANPCYRSWGTTDPTTDFLPWMTSYYNSSSTPTYVFPSTGRFGKGLVHIEVTVLGGPGTDGPTPTSTRWTPPPGTSPVTQWAASRSSA